MKRTSSEVLSGIAFIKLPAMPENYAIPSVWY